MLQSLHIRNFAIIEDATLEFGPGLNVLSGETGAGKSIIIQALALMMGQRGKSDWIRKGEESAVVTGLFGLSDSPEVLKQLDDWGVPLADPELLIQRTIARSGKNQVRLNGMPATVTLLVDLSSHLVDLVSQKESEQLLHPEIQRQLVDDFGCLDKECAAYREIFDSYGQLHQQLLALEDSERSNREAEEFLRFQLSEIREAKLEPNEDEQLRQEKGLIKNASRLGEISNLVDATLVTGENNVHQQLAKIEAGLLKLDDQEKTLEDPLNAIQSVQAQLNEVAHFFSNYLEGLNFEPSRLEEIESRLAAIDLLKKKYGASIENILEHAHKIEDKLTGLENFSEDKAKLQEELSALEKQLKSTEKTLQKKREKVAAELEKKLRQELSDLGMADAIFQVHWSELSNGGIAVGKANYDRFGAKKATFYLQANQGEDSLPLAKVASGGERSRILLALKKVVVDFTNLGTSVYDEVDEGVGGATATKIGEKLAQIAKKRQTICITHQPLIAAYADQHFVIHKESNGGRTHTKVTVLPEKARAAEIARMLGGEAKSQQAMKHASKLLEEARSC